MLDHNYKIKGVNMKKVIVYLSALILGTVVVFGGTKGDVGGPGTICGGSIKSLRQCKFDYSAMH